MRSPVVNSVPNRYIGAGRSIKQSTTQQDMMACSFIHFKDQRSRNSIHPNTTLPATNSDFTPKKVELGSWKTMFSFYDGHFSGASFDFHSGPGFLISGAAVYDFTYPSYPMDWVQNCFSQKC